MGKFKKTLWGILGLEQVNEISSFYKVCLVEDDSNSYIVNLGTINHVCIFITRLQEDKQP